MSDASRFLDHFRRQRRWTRELVAAVPQEHFDWAPAEDSFSAGQLVRHLMQAEVFWRRLLAAALEGERYDPVPLSEPAGEARMREFRRPNVQVSADPKLGSTFDELLAAWSGIQEATEELISGLDAEQLTTVEVEHPLTGLRGPLDEFLIVMCEHEAHHRGQLSAYLKVLGVEQPASLWT